MKKIFLGLVVVGFATALIYFNFVQPQREMAELPIQHDNIVDTVLGVTDPNDAVVDFSLTNIDMNWEPPFELMLVEAARFCRSPGGFQKVFQLIDKKNQTVNSDVVMDVDKAYMRIWNRDYNPHPDYATFKGKLHETLDPSFKRYFEKTDNAKIRLDEIRWGGVKRDGIPPLKDPKMLEASEADYLGDDNVVFGVVNGDDVRCYPKRILAWHEMFKDTIGGTSFCGVY